MKCWTCGKTYFNGYKHLLEEQSRTMYLDGSCYWCPKKITSQREARKHIKDCHREKLEQ